MYTDSIGLTPKENSGFKLIKEPDNTKLQETELNKYIKYKYGKYVFEKQYELNPGAANSFEFASFDYYHLTDRLIWTVQTLSDSFSIQIINKTGFDTKELDMKIHHHNEDKIIKNIKKNKNKISIDFNSEILPYQGFEVIWRWENKSTY